MKEPNVFDITIIKNGTIVDVGPPVSGYVATICNGTVTRDHDTDTGERPGRLVRS